jgi:hypothetical protein
MFNQLRIALVNEASRQPIDQSDRLVRAPQQQRPGIRAHRPAIKGRHHAAPLNT